MLGLGRETIYGGGAFDRANLEAMAGAGCRVLVVLAFNPVAEPTEGWRIVRVPIRRQFRLGALITNLVFFLGLFWLWYMRGERWDWLRMGDPYFTGPACRMIASLTGTPILAHVHHVEPVPALRKRIARWSLAAARLIWTPSEFSRDQAIKAYALDSERVFFAHNAVPELERPDGDREDQLKRLGLEDRELVLFVGGMVERKNLPVLVRAFARVAEQRPKAVLALAGDAPRSEGLKAGLTELAGRLGISDRVRMMGRVDGLTKARLLKGCLVFVLPSKMEGFGLAAAEAMQMGVPVVASNVGGLKELVRHGKTGLLVEADDADGLADAILDLLGDPEQRRAMGDAAARDISERFSWKRQAEIILERMRAVPRRPLVLGVMLNSGDGLAVMEREGQRSRFVDLYLQRYSRLADKVYVFTYGQERDRFYGNTEFVPGMNTYGLVYGSLLPLFRRRQLRECTLLRVMQIGGALPAVGARLLWRIPYAATYGYRYVLFAKIKGRPVYGLLVRAIERLGLAFADKVFVTTRSLEQHVLKSKSADRVAMLPNGVDLQAFAPKEHYDIAGSPAKVIYVGRIVGQKNLPLLVRALSRLDGTAELLIVGDGDRRAEVLAAAGELGVQVTLLGTVPHEKLPGLLAKADVFCLPSRIEGHPKSLIEAMAAGLPCVATNVTGTVDVIDDDVNGLLAAEDAADLAEKLKAVLGDRELACRLGKAARAKAVQEYDLQKILDREEEILKEMLEGAGG